MEAGIEDDYANQLSMVYPPITFEHVSDDDHTLLRPIYVVMYALDVNIFTQPHSKSEFLPIAFDSTVKEYTMVCNYDPAFVFSYRLFQALWSTNPARIRSMRLEPCQHSKTGEWMQRVIVKVISLQSTMVSCSFAAYLKADKTLLRPGFDRKTAAELAITNDAVKEETDLIERIISICEKMVKFKSVVHNHETTIKSVRECIETQRNSNGSATVRWHLPHFGGVDVVTASVLWSEVGTMVDDICFGLIASEKEGVHHYIDIILFSPGASTLRLVNTHHQVYYSDPNKVNDPWKVEVTGPYHMENDEEEQNGNKKRKPNKKKAGTAESIVMNPPSRKRLRSNAIVAPTPTSSPVAVKNQRRQPDAVAQVTEHFEPRPVAMSLNDPMPMDVVLPTKEDGEDEEDNNNSKESSSESSEEEEEESRPAKRQKTGDTSTLSHVWNSLPSISWPFAGKKDGSAAEESSSSESKSKKKNKTKKKGKKSNGSATSAVDAKKEKNGTKNKKGKKSPSKKRSKKRKESDSSSSSSSASSSDSDS